MKIEVRVMILIRINKKPLIIFVLIILNSVRFKEDVMKENSLKERLPLFLRPFFWDVDFNMLSVEKSAFFIISRLMEHGDEEAVNFLFRTYSRSKMIDVLKRSRSISRRSRNFWRILLDQEGDKCTPKRYPTPYGTYF